MLCGMATVTYYADDLESAKDWYSEFLGTAPYFTVPGGYYEFRIGDYQAELGLINRKFAPSHPDRPGGQVVNWHVDDLKATFERLLSMGAKEFEPITERGAGTGFVTAAVVDPFGNVLGIMSNPHYLEMLAQARITPSGT
ncbi:VOC family protein [Nocardia sp. SYP-A9097]|uniref:VOC family protein n=1 Tax=Nocardia sp. SYP-A9097 TaxID=2663237 RepID=UPI00129ABC3D|nr:VOC family protein [Nocardia sp. SYP-A9097]MRH89667.1 VOC family protein [Nocardia sp. SYP-A9097]